MFNLLLFRTCFALHGLIVTAFLMITCCLLLHLWFLLFLLRVLLSTLISFRYKDFMRRACNFNFWHPWNSSVLMTLLNCLEFHIHRTRFILLISLLIESTNIRAHAIWFSCGIVTRTLTFFIVAPWFNILGRVYTLFHRFAIWWATSNLLRFRFLNTILTIFVTFLLFYDRRVFLWQWRLPLQFFFNFFKLLLLLLLFLLFVATSFFL